jgi:hypothetical protein
MNSYTHLDTAQEMSTLYNNWLVTNFHQEINTNPFQPEYKDDMDIVHVPDPYDYLIETFESFEYNTGFDDSMFNEAPNLELHSDNEDDGFDYTV